MLFAIFISLTISYLTATNAYIFSLKARCGPIGQCCGPFDFFLYKFYCPISFKMFNKKDQTLSEKEMSLYHKFMLKHGAFYGVLFLHLLPDFNKKMFYLKCNNYPNKNFISQNYNIYFLKSYIAFLAKSKDK